MAHVIVNENVRPLKLSGCCSVRTAEISRTSHAAHFAEVSQSKKALSAVTLRAFVSKAFALLAFGCGGRICPLSTDPNQMTIDLKWDNHSQQ